jgi:aspartyl-tRNA(Asn)/glutamyl-tRNA(Gln) amidotransferase subunit C
MGAVFCCQILIPGQGVNGWGLCYTVRRMFAFRERMNDGGGTMAISREQVEHVAKLARLDLNEDQAQMYTEQLNDILRFAEKLNELDTDGVEPTSHVLPMANVMREDEQQPSLPREEALRNAPDQQDGMFRVPPVFDE